MAKRHINIKTGIEIWDGLPGSGKSYSSVDELIRIIIKERRPVYTNLPLKLRVLRKLLVVRSLNTATANYIQYLSQDHFTRFIERNQIWTQFSEPMKAEGYGHAYIERKFTELHGPPKIKGLGADWIPTGSVLILDEFHRWADQRMQRAEDPAYLTYATMHRHHMHRVIIATQDAMQVSITWRRNSDLLVHHTDKRRMPFIFGLSLPIPAFAREFWPKEYIDQSRIGQKPTKVEVFIPAFTGGLVWRCYDSFTHMGGARRLNRALEETRRQVEGDDYEQDKEQGEETMSIKKGPMSKIIKLLKTVAFLALLVSGVMWVKSIRNDFVLQTQRSEKIMTGLQTQVANLAIQIQEVKTRPGVDGAVNFSQPNPPTVSMITKGYCMADGKICKIGQVIDGYKLEEVNHEISTTIWSINGMRFNVGLERMQPTIEYGDRGTNSAANEDAKRKAKDLIFGR